LLNDKQVEVPWTWIVIALASALTVFASWKFCWFKQNEHVAVWLEGVALVLIFGLDLTNQKTEYQETMRQLKIATEQAQSTEKAAIEAKKSSDILASLHRPLMGIEAPIRVDNADTPNWMFAVGTKNFGTLIATQVTVIGEVFIDGAIQMMEPPNEVVEVFPAQKHEHIIRFAVGDRRSELFAGSRALTVKIKIAYSGESGKKFEFIAETKYVGGFLQLARTGTIELLESHVLAGPSLVE